MEYQKVRDGTGRSVYIYHLCVGLSKKKKQCMGVHVMRTRHLYALHGVWRRISRT